ncbi:hypothetical protein Bca52824_053336 [Brassica carinata]|uniref:Uncharacterized protein n=1 Tax=Brassica carinata TaxID=52824 RepID=A0A8X7R5I0_BRACI|nr:hypothetical protein Bca52824_053336 [Brassica carinata]
MNTTYQELGLHQERQTIHTTRHKDLRRRRQSRMREIKSSRGRTDLETTDHHHHSKVQSEELELGFRLVNFNPLKESRKQEHAKDQGPTIFIGDGPRPSIPRPPQSSRQNLKNSHIQTIPR